MSTFLRPNKASLKNAQHFEFTDSFITMLAAANLPAAKIGALLNSMRDVFSEEDRCYMVARASEIIALREAADKKRDNFYSRVFAIVRAWAGSGMANLDASATALKKVFDLYKVKTGAQIDEESGQLDNLISDLSTAEMQAHLAALGLTWLYEQMVEAHQETKSYRMEQGAEESEKVAGALRKARQACDKVYDELTYLIEAFAKTADDPTPYEAFIKRWNGTLKIYQDIIDRKSGGSTAGTANPDGTGTVPGGTTPTTPENPDNPGTGTGGTTPTTPDNPENPGGGNGGTQPEDDQ